MKRSKRIDLRAMRKALPGLKPIPLAIVIALSVTACGKQQKATVYRTPEECHADNPSKIKECDGAYQHASSEAERTAPKYRTKDDCESEFGGNQCTRQSGTGYFMPIMSGFLLASIIRDQRYHSSPMFTSYAPRSRVYGGWYGADGTNYGRSSERTVYADSRAFDSKPATSKTLSRGGFGSVAAAKSSWSSSRSSGRSSGG